MNSLSIGFIAACFSVVIFYIQTQQVAKVESVYVPIALKLWLEMLLELSGGTRLWFIHIKVG